MKFRTTRVIHGLLGKGTVTAVGDIVDLPADHPDIPQFTELAYLIPVSSAVGADGNPPAGDAPKLDKLNKEKLTALATELKIELSGEETKAQIIEKIQAAQSVDPTKMVNDDEKTVL